ncbi:G-protein coupled receptor GRL101 [Stylophora pistillata]|uniref:G-protein coupled receptor GRL101 n=1 Tax=Stylophora pistillata TaxID=50429 RepID=A0A2B4RGH3_STYPI|nr:G-protein coupled receptor GRL101 [Stylophora pistillata]
MEFFYSMYGSTVETLTVYVKINGREHLVWSRYGNQLSNDWIKGCVTLNYRGPYQVIIEGVAGISNASNIAIDDLSFIKNLSCVSDGKTPPEEIFQVNCTFDKSFCGWRSLLLSSGHVGWERTGNETGQSGDFAGNFIYSSQPTKENQSTLLLSPLILGPKCFGFSYHMSGRNIGRLDILLQVRGQQGYYLMWQKTGDQGNSWIQDSIGIGYTDEFQIILKAAVGKNLTSRIALDDFTLTDGLCDDESEVNSNRQGNCKFDRNFCFWKNDLNFISKWALRGDRAPKYPTGPSSDHTSGTGLYIYIDASSPRQPGDTARLTSPWMRGPQCMTFFYHMFGSDMGCVVMYIRKRAAKKLKPIWLRSKDQGDRWIQGQLSIENSFTYQIIIDGIRGGGDSGDAALDDFTFQRGPCQQTDETTYYVSSYMGKDYKISSRPSEHSLYSEEFRFTLKHPRGLLRETLYFVYSKASRRQSFFRKKLDLSDYNNYPLDVVVLNDKRSSPSCKKIYLIKRENMGPIISLEDYSDVDRCKGKIKFSFCSFKVTEPENHLTSGCQPGWFRVGKSCFMLYFGSTWEWRLVRSLCHEKNSEIATAKSVDILEALANQRKHLESEDFDLFLGLESKLRWTWLDGEKVSNAQKHLWKPTEPNGDGKCGSLSRFLGWDSTWRGYGWGWNDELCTSRKGYICEEPLDVSIPVALFFVGDTNKTVDLSPGGTSIAVLSDIALAPDPFGNPNSSLFLGTSSSHVELENHGEIDTRFSMSVFAWVHLSNSSTGPIIDYGCSMTVLHSTLGVEVIFKERHTSKSYLLHKKGVLKANSWNFIGFTYEYYSGVATIWVNENIVIRELLLAKMELATYENVIVGASKNRKMQFRGQISCLQFYEQALSVDQIIKVKARCNKTVSTPSVEYRSVGCFADKRHRAIPTLEGADPISAEKYDERTRAIEKCALAARKRGFTMFAVQYNGQCMSSATAEQTFNRYGESKECNANGKGGSWANNVYIIRDYVDVGCYRDRSSRAIASLERKDPLLSGWHKDRENPIEKCAIVARQRGFRMFAVQYGGECYSSSTAEKTFDRYGKSDRCEGDGKGGTWANRVYAFQASTSWCSPSFFPFHGGCFSIDTYNKVNWEQALERCKSEGGTLAKISREGLRHAFSAMLEGFRAYRWDINNYFIGMRGQYDDWTWIDGTPLNESLWVSGYPNRDDNSLGCAYLSADSSRIKNSACKSHKYPLCQKKSEASLSNRSQTNCSSVLFRYEPFLAIDKSYTTCFRSAKESDPWWQVNLDKNLYVTSVVITNKVDCWHRDSGIINVRVLNDPHGTDPTCSKSMAYDGVTQQFKFYCSPPALGNYVKITLKGDNVTLVLCQVVVETIESLTEAKGVLRETWYRLRNYEARSRSIMRDHPLIQGPPDSRIVLQDFDAPLDLEDRYAQRLTAYLQVPQSGSYVFYASCDDSCELWKYDVKENGIEKDNTKSDESVENRRPMASVSKLTRYLEWDRYEGQSSQPIFLEKCRIYRLEVYGRDRYGKDHLSVGMRKPNGDFERPIPKKRLFWTKPGTRKLVVTLNGLETSKTAIVGSKLHISAAVALKECNFESGNCAGWTGLGSNENWKFSKGHFAYIGSSSRGQLKSPLLLWKPAYEKVGLCLRFKYLMPTKSKSYLKVLLWKNKEKRAILVWQLLGYHGAGWSVAQVVLPSSVAIQVIFEGEGFLEIPVNVAIDDISITTEKCVLLPYFAKPDDLTCDGDFACKDESDEDNCGCPSNKFACQDGKCIPATAVCDGNNDCSDGDDENNCRSGDCLLSDLSCTSKTSEELSQCKSSFRGYCRFNDNFCNLKYDRNATFQWTIASGKTPTENTGPSYDHTTLSKDGSYIYIEASPQMPGDAAKLLSDWMEPNEKVCIQFWYHMYGSDIGHLSIYLKTNLSETIVWTLSGNQGDQWKFGQTALISRDAYRFIIEGTVGGGSSGDIALDDLTLLDGNCQTIITQKSLNCDFKEDTCDWEAKGKWTLSKGGSFIFLGRGAYEVGHSLFSPPNINTREWKCLHFWYFIGGNDGYGASLTVLLKMLTSKQTTLLFFTDETTAGATYTQTPLPGNCTDAQIEIVGTNKWKVLFLRQVSFSKDSCERIPNPRNDLQQHKPLGMENGVILDKKITSSSQLDELHAPIQGRLHFQATPGRAGSWSAGLKDSSPWLQVDLNIKNTRVTGVATQGRNGPFAQWVTEYLLQYSNGGVSFKYYREPRQTKAKSVMKPWEWKTVQFRMDKFLLLHNGMDILPQTREDYALKPHEKNREDGQPAKGIQGNGSKLIWEVITLKSQEFTGNMDRDTIVHHKLNPAIKARYIRLQPLTWHNWISLRMELYGCSDECQTDLGLKNRAIPDAQLSASSQLDRDHVASQGRLDYEGELWKASAWSSGIVDQSQWLQIDLRSLFVTVTGVATQGRSGWRRNWQWVTHYMLQFCDDGENFTFFKELGKSEAKNFSGNSDSNTVVHNDLNPPIRARYVRFLPQSWHKHISMRVELYGCLKYSNKVSMNVSECRGALGMQDGIISDGQISASTERHSSQIAILARLHRAPMTAEKAGSWSAEKNDLHQWLQVDLGSHYTRVMRVATQGRYDDSHWVTKYKLQYGNDGEKFQYYRELGKFSDKDFVGNSDRDTIVFHELNPPIHARFIRFQPQHWFGHIAMRVGVYGCQECTNPLGVGSGAISDKQITSSSQLNDAHAAMQGRLGSKATKSKGGSWSAASNNYSQWLEIDLRSQNINVTRVATQGRPDASQWVTKYKLQYSKDGVNFQYYKEQTKTAHKVFDGNVDQHTVVYNELVPPITAPFIRFRPVEWHSHISMRVELYGCQDDRPCDKSVDWCGWKNVYGWKRIKQKDLEVYKGLSDDNNFEAHLPDSEYGYISVSDVVLDECCFTICFWLKTADRGFFMEYKTAGSAEENEALVFEIYYGDTFSLQSGGKRSEHSMDVMDSTWHHVCVSWDGKVRQLVVFKDGYRNFKLNDFWTPLLQKPNKGVVTIGFRNKSGNASAVIGRLSGFNIWSLLVTENEILRMSYGCGEVIGNAMDWGKVTNGLIGEVEVRSLPTCNDDKRDRLVVDTVISKPNGTAVLVSPTYKRSSDGKSRCLRFRYMLRGSRKKMLTIFQKMESYSEIPIWTWKRNTGRNWVYGQVPLTSTSKFKILIKGQKTRKKDLIAVTGIYVEEGLNCKLRPLSAKQACNEDLTNPSGYIFSPTYSGMVPYDIACTWYITVPRNNKIRLEFQDFRLPDHPTCDGCSLQIFDGSETSAPMIGRFCGYLYPPIVVSSSNHLRIALRCAANSYTARFKIFYNSTAANEDLESSCSLQQECPSSCRCEEFGGEIDKRILVRGEDLLSVPNDLPTNVGAVDVSFNTLLHVDEDSFQNLTFVKTLDLGRNLLRVVFSEMLDGLSNLEILSLRSNQIERLEYGAFRNKSNMTHLYLQDNKLKEVSNGMFKDLLKLKLLNLSTNRLRTVSKETFQGLQSLEYLYLDKNELTLKVPPDAFNDLKNLRYLKLDHFILCCYAKKSIGGVDCESPVNEFSSCDDLMKNKTLQTCIWILGILAFFGNLLVILWRIVDTEENRVHSFLLKNLALADMFMGVYLLAIAIMDARWQGEYFKHDHEWRSGWGCRIIGVLSMLSSEVSVLILTIITMDRFICIVFPFKFRRLTYKSAVFTCTGVWVFGIVISVIPITGLNYFYDKSGDFGFYSRSAVCLPLQLSEGTPAGWEYSTSFFIGMNFISFTFILVAYLSMFLTVKRVTHAVRSTNLNRESAMAKRLVFIVMTDFCCWMPIIIISILSLTGNFNDPDKIAYVWIAVFVLPLNSSLNPILYTFSTDRAKRSLSHKGKNVTGFVMKTLNRRTEDRSSNASNMSGKTLLSKVLSISSPKPKVREMKKPQPEIVVVQANLKLIEEVNIFKDDTVGKQSTGYVTAWCEVGGAFNIVLLKYFGKGMKEEWTREVAIVQHFSCDKKPQSNVLQYRWHSKTNDLNIEHGKTKIDALQGKSFLICYDFVSSSTLEDFICEKGTVIDFESICTVACDVLGALEELQELGVLHNNITTRNILISQCARIPPIKAILGGFSRASTVNEESAFTNHAMDEQSCFGSHVEKFGKLLATLLGHCHGSSEQSKLHEIMNLCFEKTPEKRPTARCLRELLEEVWCTKGFSDSFV